MGGEKKEDCGKRNQSLLRSSALGWGGLELKNMGGLLIEYGSSSYFNDFACGGLLLGDKL